jgi:endonuclease YncB( thermonuclease family)
VTVAKAIEDIGGLKVGHLGLGMHGAGIGSVAQQVHDGDTIVGRALGNLSVRFLGVDTPEISFSLPRSRIFDSIGGAKWAEFLADPLADRWGVIDLAPPLRAALAARTGTGCAANHHRHAQAAQRALEAEVGKDLAEAGGDREAFRLFVAFAHEVMDGYGRLLGYINREQATKPRPPDYNARLLTAGLALPYFIWPNINPFRKQAALVEAVPEPGSAALLASRERALRDARLAVRAARDAGAGVFNRDDPLKLEPFELRFLAGRRAPSRWVIDLSSDSDAILPPQRYIEIPRPEDRLFVPAEYVPLFEQRGWRRG